MKRTMTRDHMNGMLALTSATFLYATVGFISRFIGYSLPLFYQNWTKYLLAAVLLSWSLRQWKPVRKKDWIWIILRMLAGGAAFILFIITVNALQIGLAYFIFYGGMTVTGFAMGSLLFHEKMTPLRLFCLFLAVIGLLFVYGSGVSLHGPLFVALAFLSGVMSSFWAISTKKIAAYPAAQLAFLDNALIVPIFIGISFVLKEPWPIFELSASQGASLLIGVIFVATAILVVNGFRKLDAQLGSLVMLSEIIFVLIFDFVFFHTVPTLSATVGGASIILAMTIPELDWDKLLSKSYAYRRKSTG